MRLPVFIARRYLFSKKKQNAINIISAISVIGVTIGTTALIVILSVFNGIDSLLTEATDSFTPDITIAPAEGKFMEIDSSLLAQLDTTQGILSRDLVVEETSLVKFRDKFVPVTVKGVFPDYNTHNNISAAIVNGRYSLSADSMPTVVLGYNIAAELKARLGTQHPVIFYYPNRKGGTSLSSLRNEKLYPIGIFSAQQDIDGKYVFMSIETARKLFNIPGKISKIELKLTNPNSSEDFKAILAANIGSRYRVLDKYDLNHSFYAMMKSEKLAIFCILLFVMLIASFNIVGSVSMLIIDKKEDIGIYQALGMSRDKIISIFRVEGNLITGIGAFAGLIIGTTICLLQEHYGLLTLGEGSYIVSAYPVQVIPGDIFLSLIAVLLIGFIASHFPVRFLVKKIVKP